MITVTVDTNILPIEQLYSLVPECKFDFAIVSVTKREIEGTHGLEPAPDMNRLTETAMWDESPWDEAVWADESTSDCLEKILAVIGDGSFPRSRANLSKGQVAQFRDAMILEAHVRAGRSIFITNDERAFLKHGRRTKLEALFATRIFTKDEFITAFGRK